MSELIATDAQRLEQDAVIDLFEMDLRDFGQGVLRFCTAPVDGEAAKFNGYTYFPVPVKAEGFKWDGEGTLPTPTLTMSAMNAEITSLLRANDDLVGAPVKRIRTYRRYLDDGISPDSQAHFPVESYVIERKASHNSVMVEFELSVYFDQEGKKIPGRQVIRDTCSHAYRIWNGSEFVYANVTCPYAGGDYFRPNGEPTSLASEDQCGKRLSDCQLRFGNANLPFYGFPGAGRL